MKRKMIFILFSGIASLLFTSCIADNGVECPSDYTGALTGDEPDLVGEWVLTAIESDKEIDLTDDDEDNPIKDIYVQYTACQKDAVFAYGQNRTYVFNQGQEASGCVNKTTSEGTWKLATGTLSLVSGCSLQTMAIDFNDDKTEYTFSGNYNLRDVDGETMQTKITFTYTLNP
jgi:hypothetical protein